MRRERRREGGRTWVFGRVGSRRGRREIKRDDVFVVLDHLFNVKMVSSLCQIGCGHPRPIADQRTRSHSCDPQISDTDPQKKQRSREREVKRERSREREREFKRESSREREREVKRERESSRERERGNLERKTETFCSIVQSC